MEWRIQRWRWRRLGWPEKTAARDGKGGRGDEVVVVVAVVAEGTRSIGADNTGSSQRMRSEPLPIGEKWHGMDLDWSGIER